MCDHLEKAHPDIKLKQLDSMLTNQVYKHYQQWCKARRPHATMCSHRFSGARFNRESWIAFPELGSVYKAAVVKCLQYWCLDFLREVKDQTELGDLRYRCMFAFVRFQFLMDTSGPFFTDEILPEVVGAVRKGLLLYQKLASLDRKRTDGRKNFKIIPKFHNLLELSIYIESTKRNPRLLGSNKCSICIFFMIHMYVAVLCLVWGVVL